MHPIFENWSERGPYLYITEGNLRIVSVFDELRYDRSDADLISPAMRMHVAKKLSEIGFKQETGNIFRHKTEGFDCIIPKNHALGASPFRITDHTPKQEQDYYILTPTQTACQIITTYEVETAVEQINHLIQEQPINLIRLSDYLEYDESNQGFLEAIGHIKYLQRVALESPNLKKRRPLSLMRH